MFKSCEKDKGLDGGRKTSLNFLKVDLKGVVLSFLRILKSDFRTILVKIKSFAQKGRNCEGRDGFKTKVRLRANLRINMVSTFSLK